MVVIKHRHCDPERNVYGVTTCGWCRSTLQTSEPLGFSINYSQRDREQRDDKRCVKCWYGFTKPAVVLTLLLRSLPLAYADDTDHV